MSDNEEEDTYENEEEVPVVDVDEEVVIDDADEEAVIDDDDDVVENDDDDDDDNDDDDEIGGDIENVQDILGDDDDDDDEIEDGDFNIDEDDDDEEEFIDPRIDDEFKTRFIQQSHPEEIHESFDKINAMTKITRSSTTQLIQDENHKTYPFLTKYEKTRILGLRISQLNEGARPLVSLNHAILDNHIIAEQELKEKKLPFIIMRPLPNGKKEYWKLQDLEIIER